MKAWIVKEAAVASAKSLSVKAWLTENFNVWVPCRIQSRYQHDGRIGIRFYPAAPWTAFTLSAPISAVMVEHKLFRHSIPFDCLEPILKLLHGKDAKKWNEAGSA